MLLGTIFTILFAVIIIVVVCYFVFGNKSRAQTEGDVAASQRERTYFVTDTPGFSKPAFEGKRAELLRLLSRLEKVLDDALTRQSVAGGAFKMVPLREEIVSLQSRTHAATAEDGLMMLFIEARRLYEQVNAQIGLPQDMFFRDARQASHDGIDPRRAMSSMSGANLPATSSSAGGMSFWEWYLVYHFLFTDHRGQTRDDALRQCVDQVYSQPPAWSDAALAPLPSPMSQLSDSLINWKESPLESAIRDSAAFEPLAPIDATPATTQAFKDFSTSDPVGGSGSMTAY